MKSKIIIIIITIILSTNFTKASQLYNDWFPIFGPKDMISLLSGSSAISSIETNSEIVDITGIWSFSKNKDPVIPEVGAYIAIYLVPSEITPGRIFGIPNGILLCIMPQQNSATSTLSGMCQKVYLSPGRLVVYNSTGIQFSSVPEDNRVAIRNVK